MHTQILRDAYRMAVIKVAQGDKSYDWLRTFTERKLIELYGPRATVDMNLICNTKKPATDATATDPEQR